MYFSICADRVKLFNKIFKLTFQSDLIFLQTKVFPPNLFIFWWFIQRDAVYIQNGVTFEQLSGEKTLTQRVSTIWLTAFYDDTMTSEQEYKS